MTYEEAATVCTNAVKAKGYKPCPAEMDELRGKVYVKSVESCLGTYGHSAYAIEGRVKDNGEWDFRRIGE